MTAICQKKLIKKGRAASKKANGPTLRLERLNTLTLQWQLAFKTHFPTASEPRSQLIPTPVATVSGTDNSTASAHALYHFISQLL